jgi:hypothetical protein
MLDQEYTWLIARAPAPDALREVLLKVLRVGQCVEHARYGVGVATESNEERTTIDFYEHGPKKFVTELLEAQILAEAPPRPRKPRATTAATAAARAKKATR